MNGHHRPRADAVLIEALRRVKAGTSTFEDAAILTGLLIGGLASQGYEARADKINEAVFRSDAEREQAYGVLGGFIDINLLDDAEAHGCGPRSN